MEEALNQYYQEQGIDPALACPADHILALLRMGRREDAERVLGRPITRCPPAIPPWPPRPVSRAPAQAKVASYATNPCLPTTDAFQRYKLVRTGLTEPQLIQRGLTRRDVRRWTRLGYLKWSTP